MKDYNKDAEVLEELTTGIEYEKAKDKYQENISTAVTFLLFGVAGIVFVALNIAGILSFFNIHNSSGILMTTVLSLLFVIFIIIGIYSFKLSARYKKNAAVETDNTKQVIEWLKKNISPDDVDASYDSASLSDEMKFFERSDYLKKAVISQFPELDEDFIENTVEQYIEKIFK